MTFNDNSDISRGRVSRRTKGGVAVGGGVGLIGIVVLLVQMFTGVNLSPIVDGLSGGSAAGGGSQAVEACEADSGAAANDSIDCMMKGAYASLDTFWAGTVSNGYRSPTDFVLFDDAVTTACGQASSAVGPFYCPGDESIYIDTSFFGQLSSEYGANDGSLAQMYVVAHEWGHHIQKLIGQMDNMDNRSTGPTSDAVRLELQADCFAGAWVGAASTTKDANGVTFLKPVTQQEIADALSAAAAVGDDHIQESFQGSVNPESWTHGSSEQRQKWFEIGRANGASQCGTFEVDGSQL